MGIPSGSPATPRVTPTTPALDTTVATNYSYQWFACGAVVSLASNTDPSTVNDRRGNPKCEAIPGEVSKTFVVTNEWCGKYLLVGVQVDNTDFRFKGGTSDMRYSATSSSAVAGSACNELGVRKSRCA